MKQQLKKMNDFLLLFKNDYPHLRLLLLVNGMSIGLVPMIHLIVYSKIIDLLIIKEYEMAMQYVVEMLVITFLLGIVAKYTDAIRQSIERSISNSIEKEVTRKAFVMEYEEFEKKDSLDSIKSANNKANGAGGADAVINCYSQLISHLVGLAFSTYFIIRLFFMGENGTIAFDSFSLVLILSFAFVAYFGNYISKKGNQEYANMQEDNVYINSLSSYIIREVVENQNDLRIFHISNVFYHYNTIVNEKLSTYLKWGKKNGRLNGMFSFISTLFSGITYIYIAYKVLHGYISIGDVMLYAGALQRFVSYISGSISLFNAIRYRQGFLNHYLDFIKRPNMHYDGTLPIEKRNDNKYEFECKNVSFKYPNTDQYVLQNINIKFNIGEKLAIVGRNGAGKTTLIKLLCRLYEPTCGEILLNGINIEKYDYTEYTTIFAPVFQDFALFSIPLDENIAASKEIDHDKVKKVLQQVDLEKRVDAMFDKEHTLLYKNNGDGIEVSGGEAQRIAIARALYKDAPFIILDEPTAALDPISEAEIYENFNELVQNKTAIYISHRMSSCKFCDRIVVFKDGEIVEEGTHQTLMKHGGEYALLYNAQAEYYTN